MSSETPMLFSLSYGWQYSFIHNLVNQYHENSLFNFWALSIMFAVFFFFFQNCSIFPPTPGLSPDIVAVLEKKNKAEERRGRVEEGRGKKELVSSVMSALRSRCPGKVQCQPRSRPPFAILHFKEALRKQRWANQADSHNTFCWTQPIRNDHFNEWSIGNYVLSRLHLFCQVFEIQFVFAVTAQNQPRLKGGRVTCVRGYPIGSCRSRGQKISGRRHGLNSFWHLAPYQRLVRT